MRSALFVAVFAMVADRGGCAGGPYDPCAGKVVCEACTLCEPGAPDCVETADLKSCDAEGRCGPDGGTCAPYDPCVGKTCGETCDPCVPGEPCPMYFAATACNATGECVTVGTFTCEPPKDPCAGLPCGADCVIDPPCAPLCLMPSLLGKCDPGGVCQPVTEMKCEPPPDPCAGKGCGEPCNTCNPTLGACPAVMMYCDAAGACGYAYPACTTAVP